jgi:hypothetical protein
LLLTLRVRIPLVVVKRSAASGEVKQFGSGLSGSAQLTPP